MEWAEISIAASAEETDVIAEIFHEVGASGVVIEDPALVQSYLEEGLYDYSAVASEAEADRVTIKAYLPADEDLDGRLRDFETRVETMAKRIGSSERHPISCQTVRDEDWEDNWKAYFHTEKVGALIVIQPAWETYEASPDDIVVRLDPGSAFGTGTHPTTAMCIRAMEELVRGGMRVFDVGTGSGVLAIAAAKLGAGEVLAMDCERRAARIAARNASWNGVDGIVRTGVSDLLAAFDGKADLICANLVADLVIRLFEALDAHLAPGGALLASGIIDTRVADVTKAAEARGFLIDRIIEEAGWAAMVIRRTGEVEGGA
ncbi:MAG: 50S ribosomal protein L11 methyltransferase [Mitsuokella sp.]